MILESGELHSNDIDRAMIKILRQARQVGLNNTLTVYNRKDDMDEVD